MSSITLQSINFINNQIIITFNKSWFQEDIPTLHQLLLGNISNLCIKEHIIGADIESIRFILLNKEFILNFECYSQSCWFDTQSSDSLSETQTLFDALTENNT